MLVDNVLVLHLILCPVFSCTHNINCVRINDCPPKMGKFTYYAKLLIKKPIPCFWQIALSPTGQNLKTCSQIKFISRIIFNQSDKCHLPRSFIYHELAVIRSTIVRRYRSKFIFYYFISFSNFQYFYMIGHYLTPSIPWQCIQLKPVAKIST